MMQFYYNPVSGYSQKALIALYEKDAKFETRDIDGNREKTIRQ